MKIIATIFLLLGLTYSLSFNAQSKITTKTQVKKVGQEKEKNRVDSQSPEIKLLDEIPTKIQKPIVVNSSTKNVKTPIRSNARVSDYFSLEKEIMKRTISGEIPKSLPKHKEGQTKEVYIQILKDWGRNNLNLIKKEFHTEY